jgi:hypothetical protein
VVQFLVFGTISASVVCWAAAEVLRQRGLWAAGALLAVVHATAAFVTFYGGSHEIARVETMRQTAALTGLSFNGGIYVNYAFLAVWAADAVWWLATPQSYLGRPRVLSVAVRGFIFFIIVNGAVIFADGWARVLGAVSVMLVLASWFLRRSSRRAASTTAG